jgi:hypothetical protein
VAGFKGDAARTTQLISEIRSGILDPETGFIGKNGLTDANGCVHFHYIKVEKNLALFNSGGGGDITQRFDDIVERLQAVVDLALSVNDTTAVHYDQTMIHAGALRELLAVSREMKVTMARKFNQVTEKHEQLVARFDNLDRRFDSVDRRVEDVAQTVNDTRKDVGNLYVMVSDIKEVLRSWVNPERWIASVRMLWSVGYLGYYARGRRPTLKLVIMFVVFMALDLYHFYANANTVAEFLVRVQDSHVCEWIKTAISVGLLFVIKAWGYDPQLKEMRIDTIERNTTETHGHSADTNTRLKRFESDISARFANLEEYLRRIVGASPPLLPSHVQSQPASASQVDSDSDSESLFAETNTTEGKVEPGRSVSPAPAVMLKDRLLSYTYDRNGLSARIAAL